jgi:hypothetical protein
LKVRPRGYGGTARERAGTRRFVVYELRRPARADKEAGGGTLSLAFNKRPGGAHEKHAPPRVARTRAAHGLVYCPECAQREYGLPRTHRRLSAPTLRPIVDAKLIQGRVELVYHRQDGA